MLGLTGKAGGGMSTIALRDPKVAVFYDGNPASPRPLKGNALTPSLWPPRNRVLMGKQGLTHCQNSALAGNKKQGQANGGLEDRGNGGRMRMKRKGLKIQTNISREALGNLGGDSNQCQGIVGINRVPTDLGK